LAGRLDKGAKLLLVKSIELTFPKLTKEKGKLSEKLFLCRRRTSKFLKLPNAHGSWPESLFPDKDKKESLSRLKILADKDPSKKFRLKSREVKFLNKNKVSGIVSIRKLPLRSRTRS
jgi:hypothetical protein